MMNSLTKSLPFSMRYFRARSSLFHLLPLLGAVAGLLIALPSLFQATTVPLPLVPDGDIALVNQRPILLSDFISQAQTETSLPFNQIAAARRAQILNDMIDEELLVQRSLALDLPENDTDVRQALMNSVEAQVNAPVEALAVSDAALRRFYTAHRADYATSGTMRLRHLVLHVGGFKNADQSISQGLQDAAEAAYQIRAGATVDDMMAHYSFVDAANADAGDQFDFAAKLHLGDALYDVAKNMNPGDVSDPIQQPDGVHLLVMFDRNPPHVRDFEHVRAAVYAAYRKDAEKRAQQDNLSVLRRNAQIILAPDSAE